MEQHLARDRVPAGIKKAELKSYAAALREELRTHAAVQTATPRKKATRKKTAAA
jgi:hypothetical protein